MSQRACLCGRGVLPADERRDASPGSRGRRADTRSDQVRPVGYGAAVPETDDRGDWPEHQALNRYGPLLLFVLGIALLVLGWLDDRDPIAVLGAVLVLAGVVLPQ